MVHRAGEFGLSVFRIFFACSAYSCSMWSIVATSTIPSTMRAMNVPRLDVEELIARRVSGEGGGLKGSRSIEGVEKDWVCSVVRMNAREGDECGCWSAGAVHSDA